MILQTITDIRIYQNEMCKFERIPIELKVHEDNHPLKSSVGIWPDKFPPKHS